jgi:hypothetical protein
MHNMYNIFHNYMFQPILGHLQVVSYSPESEVTWWQGTLYRWCDLIHLYISLLWWVCVGSYLVWVFWQWRGIIDLVPVSTVVRGFPSVAQSCGNCYRLVSAGLCTKQPEDGLNGPKHVVVEYNVYIVHKKLCFVLTANCTLYIILIHRTQRDITLKSYR